MAAVPSRPSPGAAEMFPHARTSSAMLPSSVGYFVTQAARGVE
jgi:hypothetical protein